MALRIGTSSFLMPPSGAGVINAKTESTQRCSSYCASSGLPFRPVAKPDAALDDISEPNRSSDDENDTGAARCHRAPGLRPRRKSGACRLRTFAASRSAVGDAGENRRFRLDASLALLQRKCAFVNT